MKREKDNPKGSNKINYRLGHRAHYHQAWPILFAFSLLFVLPMFAYYRSGIESVRLAVVVSWVAFLVVFIPHLAIHLKYTRINDWWFICFDLRRKEIELQGRPGSFKILRRDIKSVVSNKPRAMANRSMLRGFPWDSYCYAVIELYDGRRFIISSLMIPELFWDFRLRNETVKKRFFCWPKETPNYEVRQ